MENVELFIFCPDRGKISNLTHLQADLPEGQDYDYLLGMKLWCLTEEKKNEILKQRDDKNQELKKLKVGYGFCVRKHQHRPCCLSYQDLEGAFLFYIASVHLQGEAMCIPLVALQG